MTINKNINPLDTILEEIDIQFDELISIDISEEGRDLEIDFNKDAYLDTFSYPEKLQYLLDRQRTEKAIDNLLIAMTTLPETTEFLDKVHKLIIEIEKLLEDSPKTTSVKYNQALERVDILIDNAGMAIPKELLTNMSNELILEALQIKFNR